MIHAMPPEPNPDGSYTFSEEELKNIRAYLDALKQEHITKASRMQYVKEAKACLPSKQQQKLDAARFEALTQKQIKEYEASKKPPEKSPEILAIEKALKDRYEKDLERLQQSHHRDLKKHLANGYTYAAVSDRCKEELNRLTKTYENDLKRYTQEHKEAQKILKEMQERSAKEGLNPDRSRRL